MKPFKQDGLQTHLSDVRFKSTLRCLLYQGYHNNLWGFSLLESSAQSQTNSFSPTDWCTTNWKDNGQSFENFIDLSI